MLACVHYSPETGEVLGLWTLDKRGVPRPTYRERGGHDEFWAATTMAATVPDVCWPRFWAQLASRAPYWIWWELLDVADGSNPLHLLDQLPPLEMIGRVHRDG